MASHRAAAALRALERIARRFGPGLPARKLALLRVVAGARLESAGQLRRLHELLCFLDAYPDGRRIRGVVRRLLRGFSRRPELQRHRAVLAASGIAGTDTPYRFFWPTALWITEEWPGSLHLDRRDHIATRDILAVLPKLLRPTSLSPLHTHKIGSLAALDRIRPRGLTDAEFIVGLIARMPGDEFTREAFGDRLDLSYVLRAGRDTPQRTTARFECTGTCFQQASLRSGSRARSSASRPTNSPLSSFTAKSRPASYGVSSGVMSAPQTR